MHEQMCRNNLNYQGHCRANTATIVKAVSEINPIYYTLHTLQRKKET